MNVCVAALKKCHPAGNGREKCWKSRSSRQGCEMKGKNVTDITEFNDVRFLPGDRCLPVRSFHDGFDAIRGANQSYVSPAIRE
ncbi:hypothetical protein BFG07_20290 [Kosakonia cowanii]|nr:hypothetical protein BFG07_20290 [Kosakonia cowanii]